MLVKFENNYIPEPNSGCWIWIGSIEREEKPYGVTYARGRKERAHRLSYEIANGGFDKKLCVLHRCDNPSCVNPDHLFLGTNADNVADMTRKGRQARGVKNRHARLTEAQALEIKMATGKRADIAAKYGINETNVSRIRTGARWGHLGGQSNE